MKPLDTAAAGSDQSGLFKQCPAVSQLSDWIIDRDLLVSSHNAMGSSVPDSH